MPLETIACVRRVSPDTRVLVLSACDDEVQVESVMNAGVDGYLANDEALEALIRAITVVAQGGTWFSRGVLQKFVEMRHEQKPKVTLTLRETELLEGIARGWDNRKLALELNEQTIRNYISRTCEKLGVRSRAEAVVWARKNGYASKKL